MPASETILEPSSTSPIAIGAGQLVRLIPGSSTRFWYRVNRASSGDAWTEITAGAGVTEIVWTAPTSVTRRFTFDRVEVIALSTAPSGDYTGGLAFNLVEGPVTGLFVTPSIGNEAFEAPPLDPNADESDDPPLGAPLLMAGANRDSLATIPLERGGGLRGGPLSLVGAWSAGIFVDSAGRAGARTPFMTDARGLGPFPAIAAYHHGGLYFHHDFGRARTLGLTRVLYEGADGDVAIVRGDGRRTTYRQLSASGGLTTYTSAASVPSTLVKAEGWGRQLWGTSPYGGASSAAWTETTASGRKYVYSSAGQLVRVVDRYGSPVYYTYDTGSRLQKIQGPSGSQGLVPYLSYDADGLLFRLVLEDGTTPANNRTAYFQYDASRLLTRIVGPELCVTYFGYDGSQLLTSVEDPDGFVWRIGYSGSRVDRVADALGATTYFAYDTSTAVATRKDRAGKVTYLHFNAFGSPTRVWDLGTPADYHLYDCDTGLGGPGNLRSSVNRLGRSWTYEYDARGNRIAATDPLGARSYFAYDGEDLLRTYVDPILRATYLDWDASRNRTKTIDPIRNATYFEYEPTGLLRYRKDRRGAFTYFVWDAKANLTTINDPLGHTTYFAYNPANETTAQVDSLGRITYLEHDLRGRVVKQTNPIGSAAYFAYDARCNLVSQKDALLRETVHLYDGNDNRTRSVDALGNATYLTYDPEERPASQTNARLFTTSFTYDALGRRQKVTDALGFSTYFAYDDAHQLERQVDARGNAAYFRYDLAGRVSHQVTALAEETYFGFDLAGQRVKTTDARGHSTVFEHDPRGWPRRTETAIGAVTYTAFDEEGNRLRSVDPLGKTTYFTYDLAGRLTNTTDQLLGVTYTGYDRASQTVLRLDELGAPTYMSYDAAGRSQATLTPAGLLTYMAYDLVNNVVFQNVDQGWGEAPWGSSPYGCERVTTYFAYDAINRRQTTTDALGSVTYTAYDRVGNVDFSVDARGFGTYFTYDARDRRTHTKDGVHFASTYMGYDPVGNVLVQVDQQGVTTYLTYDRLNRVEFSLDPAGALTYHAFDAVGNRTETHVLLGAGGERRSTYFQYDQSNRRLKQIAADSGQTYFVHDLAGNQVAVVDPEGRPTYVVYDELNRTKCRYNAFLEKTYFVYDARSSQTRKTDPEGRTAYLGYDLGGRLLHQSNALGEYSYFFHDARGQRTHVINPRGYSTYMRYDLLGRNTHRIDALGGVSYMAYDPVGNRTLAQDELGNATYFFFDGLNRSTRVMDATLKNTYMAYDSRSAMIERVDADGRGTYLAYDVARRLERQFHKTPVAGETETAPTYYAYNQVSEVTIVDDRLAGLDVTYFDRDKTGRITKKVTLAGAVYYAYDLSGLKRSFKDADLKENYYVHDAAGRLDREVLDAGRTAYFVYDTSGLVKTKLSPQILSNRLMTYYTYDLAGRVGQLESHAVLGGVPGLITYFSYQRDLNGQPTWIRNEGGDNTYYEYDALDRLTYEERKSSTASMYGFRYTYDGASNRTRKVTLHSTPANERTYYEYDTRNLLATEWIDAGGEAAYYAYDNAQRMTSRKVSGTGQSAYFTHDQRQQVARIDFAKATSPDSAATFAYTGMGERAVAGDNGQTTYWQHDGRKLVLERLGSNKSTVRRYRHNRTSQDCLGSLIEYGEGASSLPYFLALDSQGSVRKGVNALEGSLSGNFLHDRFGVPVFATTALGDGRMKWLGSAGFLKLNGGNQPFYAQHRGALYLPFAACSIPSWGPNWDPNIGGPDDPSLGGPGHQGGDVGKDPLGQGLDDSGGTRERGKGQGGNTSGGGSDGNGGVPGEGGTRERDPKGGDSDPGCRPPTDEPPPPPPPEVYMCGPDITAAMLRHLNGFIAGMHGYDSLLDPSDVATWNGDRFIDAASRVPGCMLGDVCAQTVTFGGRCISTFHIRHLLVMFYLSHEYGPWWAYKFGALREWRATFFDADWTGTADNAMNAVGVDIYRAWSTAPGFWGGPPGSLNANDINQAMAKADLSTFHKPSGTGRRFGYIICAPCPTSVSDPPNLRYPVERYGR